MNIQPIRTKKDHKKTLQRIDSIFDAQKGTIEYDELDILATLVEAYENKHYPIKAKNIDAVDTLKYLMTEKGLKQADLVQYIGNKGNVSSILNKKRELTLNMIKNISKGLNVPTQLFV